MSKWRQKRRARKIEKLRLQLADAKDYLDRWGWARKPSELHAIHKRIDGLEAKIDSRSAASVGYGTTDER